MAFGQQLHDCVHVACRAKNGLAVILGGRAGAAWEELGYIWEEEVLRRCVEGGMLEGECWSVRGGGRSMVEMRGSEGMVGVGAALEGGASGSRPDLTPHFHLHLSILLGCGSGSCLPSSALATSNRSSSRPLTPSLSRSGASCRTIFTSSTRLTSLANTA